MTKGEQLLNAGFPILCSAAIFFGYKTVTAPTPSTEGGVMMIIGIIGAFIWLCVKFVTCGWADTVAEWWNTDVYRD